MKLIRNYLTAEEIGIIVSEMLSDGIGIDENGNEFTYTKSEYERQMIKYGIVGQLLVDGLDINDDTTTNDIYTALISNAIDLDQGVYNIWIIDKIVREELGVAKTVEKVLNEVIANADEALKGFDPKAMLVELNNLQNKTLIK
jgi:hypothetical protein